MKSNQSEFDKLKSKIVNLDWNEDNLYKHTLKHPIGDWKRDTNFNNNQLYRLLWSNLLNIHDIPDDENGVMFGDTKEAYRKVSLDILSKLYNAIIYYHDGKKDNSNEIYRSICIFEDREYKSNEKVLVTFFRYDSVNDDYYITTCYFKNRGFKEKFYYAYMLFKEPELFKINIDVNNFFDKNGIPRDFSLDRLDKLLDNSMLNEDKIGEIFSYYVNNGKIDTKRYCYLKYLFNENEYLKDKKKIDNKLKVNNNIINYLKQISDELLKECNEEIINKYDITYNKSYGWFNKLKKVKSVLKNKYIDDILIDSLCSRLVDIENFDKFLDNLYLENKVDNDKIDDLYNDCIFSSSSLKISRSNVDDIKEKCKNNDCTLEEFCQNISVPYEVRYVIVNFMIKYIDGKNSLLYLEKDNLRVEMYMDDENLFYMSLYKNLAKSYLDYTDGDFELEVKYDNEIFKILYDNNSNNDY